MGRWGGGGLGVANRSKGSCAFNPIPPPFSRVSCSEAPTAMWQGHDASRLFFIRSFLSNKHLRIVTCTAHGSHPHPFLLHSLSPFWFAPRCQSTPLRTISSHPDECEEVHQEGGGRGVEAKVGSGGGDGRNRLRCSILPADTYRKMKHPGRHRCLETHVSGISSEWGGQADVFCSRNAAGAVGTLLEENNAEMEMCT